MGTEIYFPISVMLIPIKGGIMLFKLGAMEDAEYYCKQATLGAEPVYLACVGLCQRSGGR